MAPALDPMVGRYVRLEIEGVAHRLYFEEAGPAAGGGIPLVCLHTAGADSRQRHGSHLGRRSDTFPFGGHDFPTPDLCSEKRALFLCTGALGWLGVREGAGND